jgi:hypothetical protein
MFESIEPGLVSGSRAELGPNAGRITWKNALRVAADWPRWLVSDLYAAIEASESWARESGGWTRDEIAEWTSEESLALFVQNIASELRNCLGVDDLTLEECVAKYAETDWDNESEYPTGHYYLEGDDVMVDWRGSCGTIVT